MKILTIKNLILPVALTVLVCGGGFIFSGTQKSQSLLKAEKAYSVVAKYSGVQKFAADELNKAKNTLISAVAAKTEEDMASLAYIGNAQVETAVYKALAEQYRLNTIDLLAKKAQLINASINGKKDAAQNKLLAMEASEAEREILLAFGNIEFVSGTANLVPGASQGIGLLVNNMSKYPNKTVTLSGHTDNTASAELNRNLSQQRADFIRDVLISKGVSPDRITAIGYGENQPIASNNSNAGRQKNRRIDISFN